MCACFMCACVVMLVLPPTGDNEILNPIFCSAKSVSPEHFWRDSKFAADVAQNISEQFVVSNNRDT